MNSAPLNRSTALWSGFQLRIQFPFPLFHCFWVFFESTFDFSLISIRYLRIVPHNTKSIPLCHNKAHLLALNLLCPVAFCSFCEFFLFLSLSYKLQRRGSCLFWITSACFRTFSETTKIAEYFTIYWLYHCFLSNYATRIVYFCKNYQKGLHVASFVFVFFHFYPFQWVTTFCSPKQEVKF